MVAFNELTSSSRFVMSARRKPENMNVCPHRGSFVLANVFVRRLDLSEWQGSKNICKKMVFKKCRNARSCADLLWRTGCGRLHWVGMSSQLRKQLSISIAVNSTRSPIWFECDRQHWGRLSSTARTVPGSDRSVSSGTAPAAGASAESWSPASPVMWLTRLAYHGHRRILGGGKWKVAINWTPTRHSRSHDTQKFSLSFVRFGEQTKNMLAEGETCVWCAVQCESVSL